MGTEEGRDLRENRKAELTTDRWSGAGEGEGERSKDNKEILRLGGEEDGDAINKNRQLRRWHRAEREEYEFHFAHTFQSVPRIESSS